MNLKNCQLHYLKKVEYSQWDAFVLSSPQCSIYGQSWYLEALQRPFEILVVREKATIYGGIVLTINRAKEYANPYLGKYYGIYYADFEGSPYNQESKRRKVTEYLLPELKKLPSFDYFFHPKFETYLPFYHQGYENRVRYSYWLDLKNQSIDQLWENFRPKLRTKLRKADQQGFQLIKAIDFEDFFSIYQQTFTQKNTKFPFTYDLLKRYYDLLSERSALQLIGLKNNQGLLVAVAGLLNFERVTTLILNGFDKKASASNVNEWLLYQVILQAKEQGDYFDFEGSMLPTVEPFFRKFGGTYTPYLNIYKYSFGKIVYGELRRWYRKQ